MNVNSQQLISLRSATDQSSIGQQLQRDYFAPFWSQGGCREIVTVSIRSATDRRPISHQSVADLQLLNNFWVTILRHFGRKVIAALATGQRSVANHPTKFSPERIPDSNCSPSGSQPIDHRQLLFPPLFSILFRFGRKKKVTGFWSQSGHKVVGSGWRIPFPVAVSQM